VAFYQKAYQSSEWKREGAETVTEHYCVRIYAASSVELTALWFNDLFVFCVYSCRRVVYTDSITDYCGGCSGLWAFQFFSSKTLSPQPLELPFGSHVREPLDIHLMFFTGYSYVAWEIVVLHKILEFFCGKVYSCQNFVPMGLGSPSIVHSKFSPSS